MFPAGSEPTKVMGTQGSLMLMGSEDEPIWSSHTEVTVGYERKAKMHLGDPSHIVLVPNTTESYPK